MQPNDIEQPSANTRRYVAIGRDLKKQLSDNIYEVGQRLPTERDIAESYGVSRTVVREAIIMLEIEGLVQVRKGSGVYIMKLPHAVNPYLNELNENSNVLISAFSGLTGTDIGPFELLQARQLIESNIAEFAACQITKLEISELKKILEKEKKCIELGETNEDLDRDFHILIAEATKNTFLVDVIKLMWRMRLESKMWAQLHSHIETVDYRKTWLNDHALILSSLQKRDPLGAKKAMWQHLENVKTTLLKLSDVDDEHFDGYLFDSHPLIKVDAS